MISDWSYARIFSVFGTKGCTVNKCFYHKSDASPADLNYCALNLSDAILQSGYVLPTGVANVNFCDQPKPVHADPRVRNADGLARIVKKKNAENVDASTWAAKPTWKGIVFFSGGPDLNAPGVTGHIDLWDGTDAVHASYPTATTIWFWQLAK